MIILNIRSYENCFTTLIFDLFANLSFCCVALDTENGRQQINHIKGHVDRIGDEIIALKTKKLTSNYNLYIVLNHNKMLLKYKTILKSV